MAQETLSPSLSAAQTPTGRRSKAAGFLIAVCWLAAFLPMLDTSIVNLALPQLTSAFGLAPNELGWVTNAYLLPLVVAIPAVARLGDATDRARLLLIGAALFAAASLGAALATSWAVLLAMRALQGLGASALATMSMAMVSSAFRAGKERDWALGWYLSGPAFGGALGPIAGAALTAVGGWRMMFLGQFPLALIVAFAGLRLSSPARGARKSLDPAGIVLAATTLFGACLGLLQAPAWGWISRPILAVWLLAFVSAAGFVVHELRTPDPLVRLSVFNSRSFLGSGIAGAGVWFGVISGFMLLPLYLESARGFTALHASLLLGAWPLGALLMYPFAGRIVARGGPARMTNAALAVTLLASIAMLFYGPATPDAILVLVGLPLGAATAIGQVGTAAAAVSEFADRDAGVAAGMFNILRQLGALLGGALPASMLSLRAGGGPGVSYAGLQDAFASRVGVLALCLLLAYALLGRKRARAVRAIPR